MSPRASAKNVCRSLILAAAIVAAPAYAQQATDTVKVSTPWARATPGGAKVGAAYLEIAAPKTGDKLLSANSPVAGVVELHTHAHENGVMRMRKVDSIPVEGGKSVKLAPGGLHVMLIDLKQPLKEGESIDLTLVFEKAGEVPVKVPVRKIGDPGPGGKAGGGHGGHGGHGKH